MTDYVKRRLVWTGLVLACLLVWAAMLVWAAGVPR